MRLLSLKLVQWRSFERCELDFPDGLIGVVGPNGAGKTTLAEAIGWALFGKLRPRSKLADVRRQGADGERALVELVFRLGDVVYRVERVIGGPAKLWIGDSGEPETVAVRTTNTRLVRELDMTWKTFERTVFARQKDVAALDPAASVDTRRRHVERLLGLERYRAAAASARGRVQELEAELRGLREAAPDLERLHAERDRAAEAAAGSDPAVADAEGALETTKKAVAELERELDDTRRAAARHAELTGRRREATEAVARVTTQLDALRDRAAGRALRLEQLTTLEGRGEDLAALATARRAWDDVYDRHVALGVAEAARPEVSFDSGAAAGRAERLEEVRAELAEHYRAPPPATENLQRRVEALELAVAAGSVEHAYARLEKVEVQHADLRRRIAVLDEDVRRDREHLDAIERSGPDAECSVCLRPYGEDFGRILTAHRERLDENAAAVAAHRRTLLDRDHERELASAACRAAERAAEAIARTTGLDELEAAREALAAARAAATKRDALLAGLEAEKLELEPAVAADIEVERAIAEHRGRVAECRAQLTVALAGLGVAGYDAEEHAAAVTRHDEAAAARDLRRRLRSEIEASAGIDDDIAAHEAELAAAIGKRDSADAELAALGFDAGCEERLRRSRDAAADAKDAAIERLGAARAAAQARDLLVRELSSRLDAARETHARIAERERSLREHDVAARILTDFRTAQNERAWPRLEEGAGALLSETTDGRYADVRLSKDYKLVIVDRGEEHDLERFSGGEQDLANLCLRLAIADWVGRERGVEMGLVVLDEVFGSQDEQRRRRLVDELRTLGNRFRQLLVITHMPDIAELCEHRIVVEVEEPGRSTARMIAG